MVGQKHLKRWDIWCKNHAEILVVLVMGAIEERDARSYGEAKRNMLRYPCDLY